MRKNAKRWGAVASKAGSVLLSGVLAAALVPAAAVAADDESSDDDWSLSEYDQAKTLGLEIADEEFTYTDSSGEEQTEIIWGDGEWTQTEEQEAAGIYIWSTYVKGDNSHYGHYDAQFTFTVEDGVLTGVDLSSQGTTFGGVWGNISKSTTITGYLPDGVTNTTEAADAGADERSFYFADVPASASEQWYFDAIYALYDAGYVTGYTDGSNKYGRTDSMKRADFVTLLWRIACPDEYAAYQAAYAADGSYACANETGMSDVKANKYYTAAVNWAVEEGIITGYTSGSNAGKFGTADSISFQQICTVLARYVTGETDVTAEDSATTLASFDDGADVGSSYTEAVAWCIEQGLVTGYTSTNTIAPTEKTQRQRIAVIVDRIIMNDYLDVDASYGLTSTSVSLTPALEGTDQYGGYSINSATLYQVASDGGLYELDEDGTIVYEEVYDASDGDTDLVAVALGSASVETDETTVSLVDGYAYDAETGELIVYDTSTDSGYGVLAVEYTIGSYYKFTQYTVLNEYGDKYYVEDTEFWAEPSGIGQKNRDQYTGLAYSLIMERELASFVEDLNSEDGVEGAAEVDIVSGATKSSDAIVEAVYAALGYYYPITNQGDYVDVVAEEAEGWDAIFTSVADDLEITMDGNTGENYTAENGVTDASDNTYATANEDGSVTVTANLLAGSDYVTLASVALYGYGEEELTDAASLELGFYTGAVASGTTGYEGDDEYIAGAVASATVNHGFLGALESCDITDASGNVIATYDADTLSVTIAADYADTVTHVAIGYTQTKKTESVASMRSGILGFAYDVGAITQAS